VAVVQVAAEPEVVGCRATMWAAAVRAAAARVIATVAHQAGRRAAPGEAA